MGIVTRLADIWKGIDRPFLISHERSLRISDIAQIPDVDLSAVRPGDVVAVIGDFDPMSIASVLQLIDSRNILVPLTKETAADHAYFLETAAVDVVVANGVAKRIRSETSTHPLVQALRDSDHAGLVLFSTGTTGRPKAILHDMTTFLLKFETPRPTLRTLGFLLFDHIGGINTLLHTMFNKGLVVAPEERTISGILTAIEKYRVELLPTTPTFLRMLLMSGAVPTLIPECLKVITYGTERMDQPTLDSLTELLPNVDFRQTFGMSELGIVRVKSEARNSLYMRIGGEGVETRVVHGVLHIRSGNRMLGYLNAKSPFDEDGWYDTGDVVEQKGEFIKVTGRTHEAINVGGLKFMPSEVERVALQFGGVAQAKVFARNNPITGQHAEMIVEWVENQSADRNGLKDYMQGKLPPHMVPKRISFDKIEIGHRFKKS